MVGEIKVVNEPQGAIRNCVRCGCSAGDGVGPFVSFGAKVKVPTAHGIQELEHPVFVCVGNAERPGCFANAVSFAGGANSWELAAERAEHTRSLEDVLARLQEATAALENADRPQLVSVADLIASGQLTLSGDGATVEPSADEGES